MQVEQADDVSFLVFLKAAQIFVYRHVMATGRLQFVGNVAAHPTEAAKNVMTLELLDCLFHTFSPQGSIEVGFKQGHSHHRKKQ
ncbi:MAG: hypothetical protein Q8S26_03070 [Azonexus sp.]|nr:hypothetical protein [Azonexus sp.]